MQTTAVQWLAEMLEDCRYRIEDAGHLIDQANKMFEQQMKEAVLNQVTTHPRFRKIFEEQFEHWFNETYGSKGNDDQVPDVRKMVEDDNYLTPVDWLMDRIKWINRETYDYLIKEGQYDRAKRMESSTSSQTEISDEEIEEMLFHHSNEYAYGFRDAIKWYREQLKKKQ